MTHRKSGDSVRRVFRNKLQLIELQLRTPSSHAMVWRQSRSRVFRLPRTVGRIMTYLRRPYAVFGIGVLCLLASMALLNTRTDIRIEPNWMKKLLTARPERSMPEGDELPSVTLPETDSKSEIDAMTKRLLDFREKVKPGNFAVRSQNTTPSDTYFWFSDQAASQASRRARIREVCQWQERQLRLSKQGEQLDAQPYYTGWYGQKFVYSFVEVYKKHNVVFCPTLKVGSTFWRRLWYAVHYEKEISSPFDISIHTALNSKRQHLKNIADGTADMEQPAIPPGRPPPRRLASSSPVATEELRWDIPAVEDFLRKAGTVMFTREPYAKLLSGYVDKLFAPNPYFWAAIGRDIIKTFRHNATSHSLRCGHDVTFPEFIKYVLKSERTGFDKRDTHFVPSFDQCQPCNISYDIVGKMETFPQDASLVLAQLGFNLSQSTLAAWGRQSEDDAILDSVQSAYQVRKRILACMDWKEASRRVWRKIQIRGIVDRDNTLPMDKFNPYSLRAQNFMTVLRNPTGAFRTKSSQKKEALSSAYSLVPREDLETLREYFLIDFDVFGYDSRPDSVFKAQLTWDVFNVKS